MKTIGMASDVVAGSTTFAGLIIVYLGAITADFASYTKPEKKAVVNDFRRKAAVGCGGVCLAASTAALALLSKWAEWRGGVGLSVIGMVLTLTWGAATAILTLREIR